MSPSRTDAFVARSLWLIASSAIAILALIALFLVKESAPALNDGHWRLFFTSSAWYPLSGQFNLWPMLVATLLASLGALLLAVPLGIAAALFITNYAPTWLGNQFRRLIVLLAGIPSVVFGLWGLTVLVPLIAAKHPPGASLLAAILILAIMILPTVVLTSESALRLVPESYTRGAQALGLHRQTLLLHIILPAARAGICSGILLAAARALGETMAVIMVAGNVVQVPGSLFDPVRVLTSNIALEMAYATGTHRASLFVAGIMLTLLVTLLAWLAHRPEPAHGH